MLRRAAFRLLYGMMVLMLLGGTGGCERKSKLITLELGGVPFTLEVADTPESRARGLMFRKELPENRGMLFVFPRDERLSFWMKNTEIPLSLAYIAQDGEIREIFDLVPHSLRPMESTYAVRYALEVSRGTFERLGIKPGYRIRMPEDVRASAP